MKNALILIIFTALLTSCSHKYYYSNSLIVPTHEQEGDLMLGGHYNTSDEVDAYEIQGAYAISDHVGIMASVLYGSGGDKENSDYGNGIMGDVGIGFFNKKNKFFWSTYGGAGFCNQKHFYTVSSNPMVFEDAKVSSAKVFIQPNIGYSTKYFEALFSVRLNAVFFPSVDNNINPGRDSLNFNQLSRLKDNGPYYMVEPAITLRGGWENIKIQTQLGFNRELKNRDIYFDGFFNLGVIFALSGNKN